MSIIISTKRKMTDNLQAENIVSTSEALADLMEEWDITLKNFKEHLITLKKLKKEVVYLERQLKKKTKKKKVVVNTENKKPSGFAVPTPISDDLADFLGLERGSDVARTTVTKLINRYITDNNLKDPNNKRNILLNGKEGEKLAKILSPLVDQDGNEVDLSYFNIQRYIKHHFLKITPSNEEEKCDHKDSPKVVKKIIKKKIVKRSPAPSETTA